MPRSAAYSTATVIFALMASTACVSAKSLDGVTLTVASMNDGFSKVLTELAPAFKAETGADLKVEIMDYGTLLTKTTADFIGDTKGYDLVTMDIVWAGAYAENKYSVDLTDWVKRDAAELDLDDIYPVVRKSLGEYNGHYVAYPFAAYANVLAYRKDVLDAAGLKVPTTMEELVADAKKLNDPAKKLYGFVANGQKGPAVAQDWMQYNNQLGGSIVDKDGKPVLNSAANIKSLAVYKELFTEAAPPGAIEYDWGGREESFRQGMAVFMQTWSVGAPVYSDPKVSNIVGKVGIAVAPVAKGMSPQYGVGGWGLAINADIDKPKQEAAWTFIKWVTSKKIHKEFNMMGAGGFMRKSQMTDPDLLAKYDFLPVIAETYEHGNGEFRPRIPEYPEIQDLLGTAVNSVLAGAATPEEALGKAQDAAKKLF
ncbi:sugar ABC transporter [Xaviernesmea oryzae]|uniref:Sugar ABC transporter n=2 Tax=Xaviernesmea oryzae TaxID=464029 RepID=A0A1Q9B163_9HYPH|nr:sugar ABC transporter substrate-binding protein [Xaviernesmea oryzae]OLP61729.1 sugar ABC transporter [Xaviernesmea oryzae]